jgi:type II secretory pathway pseudopilin PulG
MRRLREALTGSVQRDREPGDAGISLAELLVTITIFGIMMAVVMGIFVSLTRATSLGQKTDGNVRQASNGMNEMSRIIRAGTNNPVQNAAPTPAFGDASRESLTIFAFVNFTDTTQRPIRVTFSIDTKRRLLETTTQATALGSGYWSFTGATSTSATRVIATAVAPQQGADPALFTYLGADGTVIAPQASGSLLPTEWPLVAAVQVTLKVKNSSTSTDTGVTLQNTIGIPNLTNTGAVS